MSLPTSGLLSLVYPDDSITAYNHTGHNYANVNFDSRYMNLFHLNDRELAISDLGTPITYGKEKLFAFVDNGRIGRRFAPNILGGVQDTAGAPLNFFLGIAHGKDVNDNHTLTLSNISGQSNSYYANGEPAKLRVFHFGEI